MKVRAKEILERIPEKIDEDRARFTISLDKETFELFKKLCGNRPLSNVVEELIKGFNDEISGEEVREIEDRAEVMARDAEEARTGVRNWASPTFRGMKEPGRPKKGK